MVHSLLQHPSRTLIYATVRANPGVSVREVQRLTGLRWRATQEHTSLLVEARLLRGRVHRNRVVLACRDDHRPLRELEALSLLRDPRMRGAASALRAGEARTISEVARLTKALPRSTSRRLRMLTRHGLARTTPGSRPRPKLYVATPLLLRGLRRVR